jgi:hypothetical protein
MRGLLNSNDRSSPLRDATKRLSRVSFSPPKLPVLHERESSK